MTLEVNFICGFMFGFELIEFEAGELEDEPEGGSYLVVDFAFIRFLVVF